MKRIVSVVAAIIAGAACAVAAPEVGKPAPAFTLKDTDGKAHSLADFKGKFVVLEWINHGCPFVKKHYDSGNLPDMQKEYTGKGVVWLSICSSAEGKQGYYEPAEAAKVHGEKGGASTAYLLDTDGAVGKAYGARTTPQMFVIDPEGTLVYAGAIDSIASADEADIAKATNYVKAALDAKMAGEAVETATSKPYGCSVKY